MSKALKRPRVAEKVEKVLPDEELLCVICTELVCDARQTNCCGSIYCKACIETWLTTRVNGTCPSCRSSLMIESLVVDKRSERQSAAHPRNCQFYAYGCTFIGDRKDIATHQKMCSSNPSLCTNEHCRARRFLELERNQHVTKLETDLKKQLLASVWKTPEQNLQCMYGLGVVQFFTVRDAHHAEYMYRFRQGTVPYSCKIEVKHHNVSILCWSDSWTEVCQTLKFVLIHPSDPLLNREVSITVPENGGRDNARWGRVNWMTAGEFATFSKDGKFAFGG